MSELNFINVENVEHNTKSIIIENAVIDINKEDYKIIQRITNKFKQEKANMLILNNGLKSKLKVWEEQINEYLKLEIGTEAVKVLYNSRIYPKIQCLLKDEKDEKEERQLIIKSVWINENNKPFVQLIYNNYD